MSSDTLRHVQVRRDPAFPAEAGKEVSMAQPAALPHADFTRNGAFLRLQQACAGQEALYQDEDFDMLKCVC